MEEIKFKWKEELKNEILYTKHVVKIFEAERDKWENTENWKWKEQYNRNLLYYKDKLKELNEQRKREIIIAFLTKKDNKILDDKFKKRWDE